MDELLRLIVRLLKASSKAVAVAFAILLIVWLVFTYPIVKALAEAALVYVVAVQAIWIIPELEDRIERLEGSSKAPAEIQK